MTVSSPGSIADDESHNDLCWVDFRLDQVDNITANKHALTNQVWFEPLSHPKKDMSGFNVAMIVLRMLYGNVLATPLIPRPTLEELEDENWESEPETQEEYELSQLRRFLYQNEEKFPLLAVAWVDTPGVLREKSKQNNSKNASSSSAAYRKTVHEMANLLLSSFPNHRNEDGPISFSYIMTSDLADDTLWSHPSLLYYSPVVGCAPAEAGPWTVGRKKIPTRMNAHYSLIHFDWALERNQFAGLGAFLTSLVLPRQRPDGEWLLYQPNFPKVLRVRYVPAPETNRRSSSPDAKANPREDNLGFDDLRHITVGGRKIDTSTSLAIWARSDERGNPTRQGYSIFAVVRLRNSSNPKEQDLVRTYDVQRIADMVCGADNIVVSEISATNKRRSNGTRYLIDGWKLGEPDHEYDLYYCRDELEPEDYAFFSGAKTGKDSAEKETEKWKRANDIPYESIEEGDTTLEWEGTESE